MSTAEEQVSTGTAAENRKILGIPVPSLMRFIRFCIVGGLATVVDLAICFYLIHFVESLSRHEAVVATIGFIIAFSVSYVGHRYFTFRKGGSVLKFFAVSVFSYLIRILIINVLTAFDIRGFPPIFIAAVSVVFVTYFLSKFMVFKGTAKDKDGGSRKNAD